MHVGPDAQCEIFVCNTINLNTFFAPEMGRPYQAQPELLLTKPVLTPKLLHPIRDNQLPNFCTVCCILCMVYFISYTAYCAFSIYTTQYVWCILLYELKRSRTVACT